MILTTFDVILLAEYQILTVGITGSAEDEVMVCGGIIEALIEFQPE